MEKAFRQISVEPCIREGYADISILEECRGSTVKDCAKRLVFVLPSSSAILNGTIQHYSSLFTGSEPHVANLLADSFRFRLSSSSQE